MWKALEGWHTSHTVEARGALLSAPMLTYPSTFASGLPQGYTVDVTGDGRLVAIGSGEGTVAVWDVTERRRLDVDITGARNIFAVRFSPDARMLAVSSLDSKDRDESGVKIWSIPEGKLVARLLDVGPAIGPVSWRPDGKALAAVSVRADGTGALGEWDPTTGKLLRWVLAIDINVSSLAYSRSGDRLALGGAEGRVDLVDTATGAVVSSRTDHAQTARKEEGSLVPVIVAFSPELLATSSVADNTIRLWNARTGELVRAFPDITRHETDPGQGPTALAFNADGTLLYTNSNTNALTAWDPLTGSYSGVLTQGPRNGTATGKTVLSIAVSRDGRTRVAAASDGTVLRWHTNPSWHTSPTQSVTGLAISPDGTTATAGDASGTLTTWNLRTGEESTGGSKLDSATYGVRYTPSGVRITGSVNATFTVTTTSGGMARPRTLRLDGRQYRGPIAVSPDGKLFAAAHQRPVSVDAPDDYRIGVWEVATLTQRADLAIGDQMPTELAFTPKGDRLVALTNNEGVPIAGGDTDGDNTATVLRWRVPTFTEEKPLPLDTDALSSLVFTPDGKRMLTAGTGGEIQIRDADTGDVLDHFGRHTSTVRKVALSHDGRTVATITTDDPVIRLWDLESHEPVAVLTGHVAPLNEVEFSPDDKLLVTGGTDTDVGVWLLDPTEAVKRLCGNLSDAGEKSLSTVGC
jgi:WD40 repeat protein